MRPTLLLLTTLLYSVTLCAQQQLTLLFAGDLMQHKEQILAARNADGTYDYAPCFAALREQISRADIAVANLETTLGGAPYTGYPAFSSPDAYLLAIRDAGFDVLLTANNHCLDRRQKGLERTIRLLDSLRIPHVGTYRTPEAQAVGHPLFLFRKGFRIALLNYTYGTNGIRLTPPNRINYIDRKQIMQDIRTARAWRPDVIIACMHWGYEYQSLPNDEQRELADWMLRQGVTHIIGAHTHVVQPIELRADRSSGARHAVVYSLGNFISNMSAPGTDGGIIVTLTLEKDTVNRIVPRTYLKRCDYNLVWTARPALTGEKNYRLCPADSLATEALATDSLTADSLTVDSLSAPPLPPAARARMRTFINNTHKLFREHNRCDSITFSN
jgi:poly-gamma-glutamate synthesis protein (capsule biosynthesis protein)